MAGGSAAHRAPGLSYLSWLEYRDTALIEATRIKNADQEMRIEKIRVLRALLADPGISL
jgi:hypothetical protein